MTINFYLGFFGWFGFITLHIWHQWSLWKKGKRPNYFGNFLYRAFAALICIFLMDPEFNPVWYPHSTWKALPELIFEGTSFYTLFDPILNIVCNRDIDHRGDKSGWIDPRLNVSQWWALKSASLILAILSIYVLWVR